MADRLTQLQICLDQLVEQFNATVNYVNTNNELALLDDDPTSVTNLAANAPIPGQNPQGMEDASNKQTEGMNSASNQTSNKAAESEANFDNTINELSTDIILKSRQITMLIDSLPGIGVSPESQLQMIEELSKELRDIEKERISKIEEKDKLLKWCESLIVEMAGGISKTRK